MLDIHESLQSKLLVSPSNIEVLSVQVSGCVALTVCVVYLALNKPTTYFDELLSYLKSISQQEYILILGDFNLPDINWDYLVGSCPTSNDFCDFIFDHNLVQLVCAPTHIQGKTLDLVLTNIPHLIQCVTVQSCSLTDMCDHFIVTFGLSIIAGHNDDVLSIPND